MKEDRLDQDLTRRLRELADRENMDVFGIADVRELNSHAKPGRRPDDMNRQASRVIVVGVGMYHPLYHAWLSPQEDLTQISSVAFNILLLRVEKIKAFLTREGYFLHDSQDHGLLHLGIRQAEAFRLAGLGYIGKNSLAIHPKYGPRMNIFTILTEAPLVADEPYEEEHCGSCTLCQQMCYSKAILGDGYFNPKRCESTVNCRPNCVYYSVMAWHDCDICQRVCPQGEVRYSPQLRKGGWDRIIEENRKSVLSSYSKYRKWMEPTAEAAKQEGEHAAQ